MRRRTALLLALACVVAYLPYWGSSFVNAMQWVGAFDPWRAAGGIAILCGLFLAYLLVAFRAVRWPLVVLVVLTFAPYLVVSASWPYGVSGLLVSALLLRLKPPAAFVWCGAVLAGEGVVVAVAPPAHSVLLPWLIHPVAGLGTGLALFAVVRLYELVGWAREARQELAALEVGRERARIATMLRAELGVTLSTLIHQGRRLLETPDLDTTDDLARLAGRMSTQARSLADTQRGADITEPPRQDEPSSVAPCLAWYLAFTYVVYFSVFSVWNFAWFGLDRLQWTVAVATLAVLAALHMYHGAPRSAGSPPRWWPWTLSLYTLILVATSFYLDYVGLLPMFMLVGGVALVRIRAPWSWVLIALIIPLTLSLPMPEPITVGQVFYRICGDLLASAAVFALCCLPDAVVYLRRTRGELARMAVFRERLRLARDIHDLLSFHLSGLAIKAELVKRLLTQRPDTAHQYLRELLEDAQRALGEVRAIGTDPIELSLKTELDAARALLTAAGIQTRIHLHNRPPAPIDSLLATVLREAITNAIRHSTPHTCQIHTHTRDGTTLLRITNDGATPTTITTHRHNGGLANLQARISAAGGRLTLDHHNAHFTLTAEIPTTTPDTKNDSEPHPQTDNPQPYPTPN